MASSPKSEARGLALVALSTLAYGVQPVFGKIAYAAGVEPLPLLAWRYLIASLCLAVLVRGPMPPLRERLKLWAIGSIFVGNSVSYFMALSLMPASVTTLITFSFPVIVALVAALAGVERLTWRSLVAAVAAFTGCALTAGGLQLASGLSARGVAWALAGATIYATYVVVSSRFGRGVPARLLALHLVQVSAVICALLAIAGPGLALPADPRAWLSVAAIAVVSTVVSMSAFLAGMAIVGPSRASVLASLEVVVTLALAIALLGERLTPAQWTGAALILGAVAFQNLPAMRRAVSGKQEAATRADHEL
jgi:drug/metabolite transporter (DMT)-like permease